MASGPIKVVLGLGLLYAARRFFRDWGTTKAECSMALPGDELIVSPALQATEGVWIDAPAADIWPWLLQMGQNRGGLYSFETLENTLGLQYRNADRIHPEWQCLADGDTVRLVPRGWLGLREGFTMRVVEIVDQSTLVLRSPRPEQLWDAVWSFHLTQGWEDRCRLLVRSRYGLRHPGEVVLGELAGPVRAFVTRGLLIGIKRRAEIEVQARAAAERASAHVHQMAPPGAD